ncbi:MAG: adenylate/guanylate cyclase domain-containing protein [Alphaproteobacteria bacterium]
METAPVKRRLTAILLADVVAYSRLMSVDEEGTHSRFAACLGSLIEPRIVEYGGRPVRNMGDGLLVEFDSAVAAVRCAVEIQRGLAEHDSATPAKDRIRLRIGINTGDVIVDDRDIYGNSVNIAARLEALAGPGEIYISQGVYDQVRGYPSLSFRDRGTLNLKNIEHPVRAFRVEYDAASEPASRLGRMAAGARLRYGSVRRSRSARLLSAALVLIASVLVVAIPDWRPAATPARASIVVLPFVNQSDDPSQEYLANAVTADLTADLSRMRDVLVISSGTAFTFKGKPVDTKQLAKDIGVRYLLEGGIRHLGTRIDTNVRLVEAATGAQLWADRFDHEIADLGKLKETITGRIAASLQVQLVKVEGRRAGQVAVPGALDLRLRAEGIFFGSVTPDNTLEARRLLADAARLDPGSADIWARFAQITASDYVNSWNGTGPDQLAAAEEAVRKALDIDPNLALAHFANGLVHRARGAPHAMLAAFSRAIELDPNMALAYVHKGNALILAGHPGEALPLVEHAIRLSPRDPSLGIFYWIGGRAEFYAGHHEKAIPWLRRSVQVRPNLWYNRLYLVSAHALIGETDEARELLADFNRRFANPVYTLAVVKSRESTGPSSEPVVIAARNKFYEGLRLAGMAAQ